MDFKNEKIELIKTSKLLRELFFVTLHAIPMVYLFLVFNKLPDIVPIHFNINGEADDFTNKQNLIWMLLALNGIAYLLFLIIPKIDPKKKYTNDDKIYLRIVQCTAHFERM